MFVAGSFVIFSICRPKHRPRSDARTSHFRWLHTSAVSTIARQKNRAQRHRGCRSRTLPQFRLDPVSRRRFGVGHVCLSVCLSGNITERVALLPATDIYPRITKLIFDEWQEVWNCCSGNKLHAIKPTVVDYTNNPKARYWSRIAIFAYPTCIRRPR